eukprot:m.193784 g.193784  ORF g.193784 m.193784 type:complete len:2674 (+) comp16989_c0_seq2:103-8124(+)
MMAASSAVDALRSDHQFLCNGDFISLFFEGLKGYGFVDVLSSSHLSVFIGDEASQLPPNFEQSCTFQLQTSSDLELGTVLKYGDTLSLFHRSTERYLCRSKSEATRIYMQTKRDETTHFKIMPRFKLRAVGDRIRFNDQVVLENVQAGQDPVYLHTDALEDIKAEATVSAASVKTTGIRIKLFAPFNVSSKAFEHVLKGGDYIRLYHSESNGFMVVTHHEGAEDTSHFLSSDSTVCLRQLKDGTDPMDSHDASSIWQLELRDTDKRGGRPVRWSDVVRLKNLLTGQYLHINAVTSTGAMAPGASATGDDVLFRMAESSQVNAEGSSLVEDVVHYHAFFYLATNGMSDFGVEPQWLHVDHSDDVTEGHDSHDIQHFCKTVLEGSRSDEDAFAFKEVSPSDIRNFFFALGQYRKVKKLPKVSEDMDPRKASGILNEAITALNKLILFCTDDQADDALESDGNAETLHQNMLVDLRVHESIMEFVSKPFEQVGGHLQWRADWKRRISAEQRTNDVARRCFRLLRQMCKGNSHVGNIVATRYLASITDICRLLSQVDAQWRVADTLEEIFEGNHELLSRVDSSYINVYLKMVRNAHTIDDLVQDFHLLSSLCVHEGEPILETQDLIKHAIFANVSEPAEKQLLPCTRVENNRIIIWGRTPDKNKPFEAWDGGWKHLDDYLANENNAEFYEAVLLLYQRLSLGKNPDTLLRGNDHVPFTHVMLALNSQLPLRIKTAYVELTTHLYIDDTDLLEEDGQNRMWNDLTNSALEKSQLETIEQLLPLDTLLDWIHRYFSHATGLLQVTAEMAHDASTSRNQDLTALHEERDRNNLSLAVLSMVHMMLKFGFYSDHKRRHDLAGLLLKGLHASHLPANKHIPKRTKGYAIVYTAKAQLCHVIEQTLQLDSSEYISTGLLAFKHMYEHKHGVHLQHQDLHHADGKLAFANKPSSFAWYLEHGYNPSDYACLILDLTRHDHQGLRIAALNLVVTSFNMRGNIVDQMKHIEFVVDRQDQIMLEELRKMLRLLNREDHADIHQLAQHMTEEMLWMTSQVVNVNDQPGNPTTANWRQPGTRVTANHHHQEIFRHEKAHEEVFNILHHHTESVHQLEEILHDKAVCELMQAAFDFLAFFVWHDKDNQAELSDPKHLDFILRAAEHGIHAEKLLVRLLEGNAELAQEKFGEEGHEHIEQLVHHFVSHERCRTADFMKVFELLIVESNGSREMQQQIYDALIPVLERDHVLYQCPADDPGKFGTLPNGRHFVEEIIAVYENDKATHAQLHQAELLVEYVRFLGAVSSENTSVHDRIKLHLPYHKAMLPFWHIGSAKENNHGIPRRSLQAFIGFVRAVYFPELDTDAIMDAQDEHEEALTGFDDDSEANDQLKDIVHAMASFCKQIETMQLLMKKSWRVTKLDLDVFVCENILPLTVNMLQHVAAHLDGASKENEAQFIKMAKVLMKDLGAYLKKRSDLSMNNPKFILDHEARVEASAYLIKLLAMMDLPMLEDIFAEDDIRKKLTEVTRWFDESDAKAQRTAAALTNSSHSHRHTNKRSRNQKATLSTLLSQGGRKSRGHHTGKMTTSGNFMPEFSEKSEGEKIQAELPFFIDLLREKLQQGHHPHHFSWMHGLHSEFDFTEYWQLVHIIRQELITHEHGSKGVTKGGHKMLRKGTVRPGSLLKVTLPDIDLNLEECLGKVISHFEHHHAEDSGHSHDQEEEKVIELFLRMLCGLLSFDDDYNHAQHHHSHSDEVKHEQLKESIFEVAKRLNNLGLAEMVLFLGAAHHRETVEMAARLGVLLLKSTPDDNEIDHALVKEEDARMYSQRAFLRALQGPVGRRALAGLQHRMEQYIESLRKRVHEDPLRSLHRDQDAEDLEANTILEILRLLESMCAGGFSEMQEALRHQEGQKVDVLSILIELALSFASIIYLRLQNGFVVQEVEREEAILEIEKELKRESNDINVLTRTYRTIASFVTGPHVENQIMLLEHNIQDPLLLYLTYMEYSEQSGEPGTEEKSAFNTIDINRNVALECAVEWATLFHVIPKKDAAGHQHFVQAEQSELLLTSAELHSMQNCHRLLELLDGVDEDCESAILSLLMGLLEGRQAGDAAYETLAASLFPTAAASQFSLSQHADSHVIFNNLSKHYLTGLDESAHPEDHEEDPEADTDEVHFSDAEVAFQYYMFVRYLIDGSVLHHDRLLLKLKQWEGASSAHLKEEVGRIEFLRNDQVEVLYYPIPTAVKHSAHHPVVKALQGTMISSTILLNPQQKIIAFFNQVPSLLDVVERQERYRRNVLMRILSEQRTASLIALLLAIFINLYVVFDLGSRYLGDKGEKKDIPNNVLTIVSVIHAAASVFMLFGYFLNSFPVDKRNWNDKRTAILAGEDDLTPALRLKLFFASLNYWSVASSAGYFIFYLGLSLVGLFSNEPRWYAFHIFDLAMRVETMSMVVLAVKQNLPRLMGTFALTFMLIYVFALIGIAAFPGKYGFADAGAICSNSTTFLACLRDHVYYGFYSSPVFDSPDLSFGGMSFALLYFILVVLIMSSIVAGLIIDSFAAYREQAEAIATAKSDISFVSSLSRDEIEPASRLGFEGHIKHEQHVWNYCWFLIYIHEKHHEDKGLTSAEFFLEQAWNQHRFHAIMPINRAMCMENRARTEASEQAQLTATLQQLTASIATLQAKMGLLESKMSSS